MSRIRDHRPRFNSVCPDSDGCARLFHGSPQSGMVPGDTCECCGAEWDPAIGLSDYWIDWPPELRATINNTMTLAADAWDRTYFQSSAADDLRRNAQATIRHLRAVIRTIDQAQQ